MEGAPHSPGTPKSPVPRKAETSCLWWLGEFSPLRPTQSQGGALMRQLQLLSGCPSTALHRDLCFPGLVLCLLPPTVQTGSGSGCSGCNSSPPAPGSLFCTGHQGAQKSLCLPWILSTAHPKPRVPPPTA